ncbi:hypothetical protein SUGI_0193830 [Cryptomeria japonica]|nr:hypothetical protein SUGI_0193830 [Cryptomeria japonica]
MCETGPRFESSAYSLKDGHDLIIDVFSVGAHGDGNLYVYDKNKDGSGDSSFPIIKDQTQYFVAHARSSKRKPIARWPICQGSINYISFTVDGEFLATIGREFALNLAKRGWNVVATARSRELLQSLCAEIEQFNVKASATVDIAIGIVWQCFHIIDVLINNTGFRGDVHESLDFSEDEWNKVVTTNLRGVYFAPADNGVFNYGLPDEVVRENVFNSDLTWRRLV